MAKAHKLTIRVSANRRDETVVISTTGRLGTLDLSSGPIYVQGQPLTTAPDRRTYWQAIMNIVGGNIPA